MGEGLGICQRRGLSVKNDSLCLLLACLDGWLACRLHKQAGVYDVHSYLEDYVITALKYRLQDFNNTANSHC